MTPPPHPPLWKVAGKWEGVGVWPVAVAPRDVFNKSHFHVVLTRVFDKLAEREEMGRFKGTIEKCGGCCANITHCALQVNHIQLFVSIHSLINQPWLLIASN